MDVDGLQVAVEIEDVLLVSSDSMLVSSDSMSIFCDVDDLELTRDAKFSVVCFNLAIFFGGGHGVTSVMSFRCRWLDIFSGDAFGLSSTQAN